jgi:hypothetical protein
MYVAGLKLFFQSFAHHALAFTITLYQQRATGETPREERGSSRDNGEAVARG